jgi:hypothetical protein
MALGSCPSWQNPRILLTLFLVFLGGATLGMVTMTLGAHRWMHQTSGLTWKESDKEISLQRFKRELDLTPAQAEQLESVLDDFFMYYHTLQAQLDDVRASGKKRILRILNDDQKRKFERIMAELHHKQLR